MPQHFFVHGTVLARVPSILRSGALNPDARPHMLNARSHRVFLQLLDADVVPRWTKHTLFWGPAVVFVFSPAALKGTTGSYGGIGTFESRRSGSLDDVRASIVRHVHAEGRPTTGIEYMHSHEITVDTPVSLRHCVAVLVVLPELVPQVWALVADRPVMSYAGKTYLQVLRDLRRALKTTSL